MTTDTGWTPTAAHVRAVLGGLLLASGAVAVGRPDLLVMATPLLAAALWAVLQRPTETPEFTATLAHHSMRENDVTTSTVRLSAGGHGVEAVAACFRSPALVEQRPESGHLLASRKNAERDGLQVEIRPTRWGHHKIEPRFVVASSPWNAYRFIDRVGAAHELLVLPGVPRPEPLMGLSRGKGLVGGLRSARPGSGAEFATIRHFYPGDKLRRIHWPESLRSGELHVTSTWADQDQPLVLLIDAFDDVGRSGGLDGHATSLDIAIRAAAALAEHYVTFGNRVSLITIGAHGEHRVPPGAGRNHLRRILGAAVQPLSSSGRFDRGQVPSGIGRDSQVVLLSPLLSRGVRRRASTLAARGYNVVTVDCLPVDIGEQFREDPYAGIAWRIERLQRDPFLQDLRAGGIPVVSWDRPGSLSEVVRGFQSKLRSRAGHHAR